MNELTKTNAKFWADTERINLIDTILQQEDILIEQEKLIEDQCKRIEELERRLNLNSQNSSKPPSTDVYEKKRPQNTREKSGLKPGDQPGHFGTTLQAVEAPDLIERHDVVECEHCHHNLSSIPVEKTIKRQVADIPQIKVTVTEHHMASKTCPSCKKVTIAPLAQELTQSIQYGDRIKAVATYLGGVQLLPIARTAEVLKDIMGVEISEGTLVNIQTEMAAKIAPSTEQIKELLTQADVINADETSARLGGKTEWVHTASNENLTSYAIHPKRGSVAMDEIGILPRAKGTIVSDEFVSYNKYEASHALCNAHVIRELKGIIEAYKGQPWAQDMRKLLRRIARTVEAYKNNGATELPEKKLKKFSKQYDDILTRAFLQVPITTSHNKKRGRQKQHPAKNLYDRLVARKEDRLRFMHDFKVPFTNNQAERDLRMIKLKIKISGCYRSRDGAQQHLTIRSYVSTARKQNVNVLDALHRAAKGKPDFFTAQPNHYDFG
jgi:transposase